MRAKIEYAKGYRWPDSRVVFISNAEPTESGLRRVKVQCDCGTIFLAYTSSLQKGSAKSCGCLAKELSSERLTKRLTKHGMCNHWAYSRWEGMIQRCESVNHKSFKCYERKQIGICFSWRTNFALFAKWLENQGMTALSDFEVHRKDSNEGYYPDNCVCLPKEEHRAIEHDRLKSLRAERKELWLLKGEKR